MFAEGPPSSFSQQLVRRAVGLPEAADPLCSWFEVEEQLEMGVSVLRLVEPAAPVHPVEGLQGVQLGRVRGV